MSRVLSQSEEATRKRANRAKRRREGRCVWCPEPAVPGGTLCKDDLLLQRGRSRQRKGSKPWTPGHRGRKPLIPDAR